MKLDDSAPADLQFVNKSWPDEWDELIGAVDEHIEELDFGGTVRPAIPALRGQALGPFMVTPGFRAIVVVVEGPTCLEDCHEFMRGVLRFADQNPSAAIVYDLRHCPTIQGSRFVGCLIHSTKIESDSGEPQRKRDVVCCKVSEEVKGMFKVTKLDQFICICESLREAFELLRANHQVFQFSKRERQNHTVSDNYKHITVREEDGDHIIAFKDSQSKYHPYHPNQYKQELHEELMALIGDRKLTLSFDLDGTTHIPSFMIGALISTHKALRDSGCTLRVINVSESTAEVFVLCKLHRLFRCYGSDGVELADR